jgi:anti-sigma B factor antagonist
MEIRARVRDRVCILDLSGRMTLGGGDVVLKDKVTQLLGTGEQRFVLNMAQVPYLDSAAVGEIVAAHKRVREAGGEMKVVLGPRAQEVFVITRLNLVLDVHDDEDSAVAAFQ